MSTVAARATPTSGAAFTGRAGTVDHLLVGVVEELLACASLTIAFGDGVVHLALQPRGALDLLLRLLPATLMRPSALLVLLHRGRGFPLMRATVVTSQSRQQKPARFQGSQPMIGFWQSRATQRSGTPIILRSTCPMKRL